MNDGEALVELARALGPQVVVSLFSGREVAVDSWREIAERHSALTMASGGKPLESEAEAAGILAEVICSSNPETARELSRRIPHAHECEFYRLAADAIICDRVVRFNPRIAEPHAKLADSLYELIPGYYQSVDNYETGTLRILFEYIAFFARVEGVLGRFSEASSLTAGVSQLASKHGIYRYVESAVEIGDRVLAENSSATGRDALGLWTIANNLANLHIALAQDQPPASTHEYEKALACAEAALVAANAATGEDVQRVREATLQKLVQLHANLATSQVNADEHVAAALRLAEEYVSAASDREDARQWAARVAEAVRAAQSESMDTEYDSHAAALEVEYYLAAERIGEWPQESARRIVAAEGGPEQRAQIAGEFLAELYDELAVEMDSAIMDCGFDWSICKLLLALGAIASGRLGELTGDLVQSWLTNTTAPQDREPWTSYRARQYMQASGEGSSDRASAAGRIIELAMLAASVESSAPDVPFREMLRTHNAALLKRIVGGRPIFQECSGPAISPEEDLQALQNDGQRIFRPRFDHANQPTSQTPDGQQGQP